MKIEDILEKVNNKDDFIDFMHHLITDFETKTNAKKLEGLKFWIIQCSKR